jgi:hypothetical protein
MSIGLQSVRLATERRLRNDQYVTLVRDRKQASEKAFLAYYQRLARFYDRYRGIYSGRFAQFRNNIHIPLIYSIIQSDVAKKVQMMLGNWPLISFEGYPPEQEATAKKNEVLISIQFEDAMMYLKTVDFLTTLDLYGTAVMRTGWRRDQRFEKLRVPIPIAPGISIDQTVKHWRTLYDGPDSYVVDPLDFFPQTGFRFIETMSYATERYWRDLDDMRAQVAAEQAAGVPPDELSFDPQALTDLAIRDPGGTGISERLVDRISVYRNQTDYDIRHGSRFAKLVEVWDHWGNVPAELVPADGQRQRHLVVLNGRVLAKNSPNPNWHGQLPWKSAAIGDPHYFHGIGKSELLEKLQAASNRMINHMLDVQDLTTSPVHIANSSVFPHQNLVTQPGRVIHVDGPVDDSVIRPVMIDRAGMNNVPPTVEMLWRYMQTGSGIAEDAAMGMGGGGDRTTAHEFQGRQEAVMSRIMSETRQIEESWLEPTANIYRALNRQYLTLPKEINMLGSLAVQNQVTGMPLPPDQTSITHEDLWPDYRARAVGANQAMMRSARQQNVVQLMQGIGAIPQMAMTINWINFARQLFEIYGFRNINELMLTLPQAGMLGQMMGTSPQGAIDNAGNPAMLPDSHMETVEPNAQTASTLPSLS